MSAVSGTPPSGSGATPKGEPLIVNYNGRNWTVKNTRGKDEKEVIKMVEAILKKTETKSKGAFGTVTKIRARLQEEHEITKIDIKAFAKDTTISAAIESTDDAFASLKEFFATVNPANTAETEITSKSPKKRLSEEKLSPKEVQTILQTQAKILLSNFSTITKTKGPNKSEKQQIKECVDALEKAIEELKNKGVKLKDIKQSFNEIITDVNDENKKAQIDPDLLKTIFKEWKKNRN